LLRRLAGALQSPVRIRRFWSASCPHRITNPRTMQNEIARYAQSRAFPFCLQRGLSGVMVGSSKRERPRMSARCPCQHCNINLEFEPDQAGRTVVCPSCGMETILFIPPVQPAEEAKPAPVPQPRPETQDRAGEYLKSIHSHPIVG
jgi:hypothetical protein